MRWTAVCGAAIAAWSAAVVPAQTELGALGSIAVVVPAGQRIAFAEPFVLEVHRAVRSGCTAEPFDEQSLAPASLWLEAVEGTGLTVHRYTARVFASGEVVLPAPTMRVREADGTVHRIEGAPTKLNVRSILPDPPGDIEWAGDVRDLPTPTAWWWIVLVVVLVGGGVAASWRQQSTVAPQPPTGPPEPPLHEPVLAELEALQIAADADRAAVTAYYVALAAIVRSYTGRRFGVPALVRTSEELLRSVSTGAELLAPCLQACDLVKFAAARPTSVEHETARALAMRFVRSTAAPTAVPS